MNDDDKGCLLMCPYVSVSVCLRGKIGSFLDDFWVVVSRVTAWRGDVRV